MNKDRMRQLAYTSTLEQFAGLLREYGQNYFSHYYRGSTINGGSCLNTIKTGANDTAGDLRIKKNALIEDYLMDRGEFAKEKKEVPATAAQELHAAIEELTRTFERQLGAVREELAELKKNPAVQTRLRMQA